jgi:hypothetical protein
MLLQTQLYFYILNVNTVVGNPRKPLPCTMWGSGKAEGRREMGGMGEGKGRGGVGGGEAFGIPELWLSQETSHMGFVYKFNMNFYERGFVSYGTFTFRKRYYIWDGIFFVIIKTIPVLITAWLSILIGYVAWSQIICGHGWKYLI